MVSSLFSAESYFFLAKSTKKSLASRAALLAQICTKSFVGWGFAPNPTGGAYITQQTP